MLMTVVPTLVFTSAACGADSTSAPLPEQASASFSAIDSAAPSSAAPAVSVTEASQLEVSRTTQGANATIFGFSGVGVTLPVTTTNTTPQQRSGGWMVRFTPSDKDEWFVDATWFGPGLPGNASSMEEMGARARQRIGNDFSSRSIPVPGAKQAAEWRWSDPKGDPELLDGEPTSTLTVAALGSSGYYYELTFTAVTSDPDAIAEAEKAADTIFVETSYPR
ncbi:hypothetical protein HMPREF1531_00383 [Propionibacterium sp. oral taxon 192 str. F0372]|nr:hypothetical protein HMPREF1531_00383 [Propionibacterium sp. oral taxon 192 str. F0372]